MGKIGSVSDFDLSKQVIRHPCQITSVGNLVAGDHYAYVLACNVRGYIVSDYTCFGIFFAGEEMAPTIAQIRRLKRVRVDTLGFTLHSDGWIGDLRDKLDGPSHVQWSGTRFCSYSGYGLNYGLQDVKPACIGDWRNTQHYVVVPWLDWKHNPKILCDYEKDQEQVQAELSFAPPDVDIDARHKRGRDDLLNSVFGQ